MQTPSFLRVRAGLAVALSMAATLLLSACGDSRGPLGLVNAPAGEAGPLAVKVLSNRADLISGGDALIEIVAPAGTAASTVVATLNGQDVSSQFALRENGRLMAKLIGLKLGDNQLSARIGTGAATTVAIVNHPNGGPIFGGPQLQPYTCSNAAIALNAQCDQPAEYSFLYKSTDPSSADLLPYDPANPPTDVAMTTTDNGEMLPFIVRQEKGFQDRDRYTIMQLFDASKEWKPWAPQPQWNRKLLITHGGSCGTTYTDGGAPLDDYSGTFPPNPALQNSYVTALGLGFAVATTALDNLGHNCSLVTAAESLMMVKERLIEEYGELRYTLGTGCSGGSITQHHVANAYPGVYQGLIVTCSYPDVFTTAVQFADAHLLRNFFEDPSRWSVPFTPQQFADIEGYLVHVNAVVADEAFFKAVVDPSNPSCNGIAAGTGPDKLYNASSNPGGARCNVTDYMINVFGPREPAVWSANEKLLGRGFAGFPAGNVGVQYGLGALQSGKILADQFIDVNKKVGGLTIDALPQADRLKADTSAIGNAYRTGAVNVGTHLDKVPIIDGRGPDPGAAHDSVHFKNMRARLDAVHGTHANQALWEGPAALIGDAMFANNALEAMDRWVSAMEKDVSSKPLAKKVLDNRPADIGDACYSGAGVKVSDGACPPGVVPYYSTPRIVAGDSLSATTNACQLKPLSKTDNYGPLGLSDDQFTALQAIFPDGVCDFSKPPVGYQPTIAWLTYQKANGEVIYGGAALPAAPSYSGQGWASPAFAVFR